MKKRSIVGSLLGTSVGDSLGLPYEFLSPKRIKKIFGNELKQNFVFGRGMVSDDTEHSYFVAMSLIKYSDNLEKFKHFLAWRFRWWLLAIPAGIGYATLRSIIKLWLGFSPNNSGVFSAGNGPAMRSSIIGVALGHDPIKLREFVRASTRISHTDPKAYHGAMAIAVAAYMSSLNKEITPLSYLTKLSVSLEEPFEPEFWVLLEKAASSADRNEKLEDFVITQKWENGVSGYVLRTVAAVIHVWLRHQDNFKLAIEELIKVGGDTDTTAAILGGIIGARVGKEGIPKQWLENILEWPRSTKWIESVGITLADKLSSNKSLSIPFYNWLMVPLRNLFFIIVIFLHGVRRLLPPY